jgi:hypothetical protein
MKRQLQKQNRRGTDSGRKTLGEAEIMAETEQEETKLLQKQNQRRYDNDRNRTGEEKIADTG